MKALKRAATACLIRSFKGMSAAIDDGESVDDASVAALFAKAEVREILHARVQNGLNSTDA